MVARLYFLFLFSFILSALHAQESVNPSLIERTVLQGESITLSFNSNRPINILSSSNVGSSAITVDDGGGINLISNFSYIAGNEFEGISRFVVDYSSLDGIGYTTIRIKVVRSLLEARPDHAVVNPGQNIDIDVLSNDVAGNGNTSLVSIDPPRDGSAEIVNGIVRYTAPADFSGLVHFNYFSADASAYRSAGVISVLVRGASMAGSSFFYTTDNRNPLTIILDDETYQLETSGQLVLGSISSSGFGHTFVPNPIAVGTQPLIFRNAANETVTVSIQVLDANESTGVAVPDRVFTNRNSTVSFDPRVNDLRTDIPIIAHSPELSLANGILSYQAPAGFSGVKTFSYTILDGVIPYTASIEIYVGDYLPSQTDYSFEIPRGTPLILDYTIPITNYSWSIISQPRRGRLDINLDAFLPSDNCDAAHGYRMIVYQPNVGFTGDDTFAIEYCTGENACRRVNVKVLVLNSSSGCGCVGRDCVWSGDTDNDGVVSLLDLLPIGLHYGEGGTDRTEISDAWIGLRAEDWHYEQVSGINLKYIDANGDGVISAADTVALARHLNRYHNLTPSPVIAQKDEAIRFVPRETSYQAGDLAEFDIVVGSESHPAKDLHGIAFSFQLPAHLVDASTLRFQFEPSEWFGQGSPVISMYHIRGTTVEASIVRTNGRGISGIGSIGSTGIVITIDLDGVRPEDKVLPFEIKLGAAHATSGNGGLYALPAVTEATEVVLGGHDEQAINTTPTIVLYPNPAVRQLQIHANGGDELIDIDIYSLSGMRVYTKRGIHQQGFVIDTHLPTGMYAAHIVSANGYSVHKVQIVAE